MHFLRFVMALALVVWVGGLIFFVFVVAPTVFTPGLLPSRHMAGEIVSRSIGALHWMGIVCGVLFLIASVIYNRMTAGHVRPLAARHVLIVIMLLLTAVSQFAVMPKMNAARMEIGATGNTAPGAEIGRLHNWSAGLEGGVLLLGFIALYQSTRDRAGAGL